MCADLWSMACFLWTAPNKVAQGADRSKRGRAWAREAARLQAALAHPVRLAQEIRVFKLAWESKRQTAYARWVRAEWSHANGGWNRRRKIRRGTGAKAKCEYTVYVTARGGPAGGPGPWQMAILLARLLV